MTVHSRWRLHLNVEASVDAMLRQAQQQQGQGAVTQLRRKGPCGELLVHYEEVKDSTHNAQPEAPAALPGRCRATNTAGCEIPEVGHIPLMLLVAGS